jgi:hypothetical protein
MMPSNAKTELCRYFGTAHGCARGDKCFFAHGEHELVPLGPPKSAQGDAAAEPGSLSRQKLKVRRFNVSRVSAAYRALETAMSTCQVHLDCVSHRHVFCATQATLSQPLKYTFP